MLKILAVCLLKVEELCCRAGGGEDSQQPGGGRETARLAEWQISSIEECTGAVVHDQTHQPQLSAAAG